MQSWLKRIIGGPLQKSEDADPSASDRKSVGEFVWDMNQNPPRRIRREPVTGDNRHGPITGEDLHLSHI